MRFDFGDFLWRWAIALVLVFVTFNPTGTSYLHWVLEDLESACPIKPWQVWFCWSDTSSSCAPPSVR